VYGTEKGFDVFQAAVLLGLTPEPTRRLARKGKLPTIDLGWYSRTIMFEKAGVYAEIMKRGRAVPVPGDAIRDGVELHQVANLDWTYLGYGQKPTLGQLLVIDEMGTRHRFDAVTVLRELTPLREDDETPAKSSTDAGNDATEDDLEGAFDQVDDDQDDDQEDRPAADEGRTVREIATEKADDGYQVVDIADADNILYFNGYQMDLSGTQQPQWTGRKGWAHVYTKSEAQRLVQKLRLYYDKEATR
jgi:hypothetical protein